MFALVVRFELHDEESARAFDQLVAETSDGIARLEPGTLLYVTHTVQDSPLSRIFYEVYRDRRAFDDHERQPHVVRFLKERGQYLRATRVEFVEPASSKGLPSND